MVNSNKLKGRMRERELTQRDIAVALNISQTSVNQKINNMRPLYLDQAEKLCAILDIKDTEFRSYFFA